MCKSEFNLFLSLYMKCGLHIVRSCKQVLKIVFKSFQVTASLVRQIYTRDARRSFCPKDLWLSDRVKIHADGPTQIYHSNVAVFTQRPFRTMQSLSKINEDEGGPPLSNRDVKNLVILTELPFVVSFHERVKVSQLLCSD